MQLVMPIYRRSNMFVDGSLLVQNDGLHGMLEQCKETNLATGIHPVYIEGFQNDGGIGMEVQYSGPDTGNQMVWLQSGVSGFIGRVHTLLPTQQPRNLKIALPGGGTWKVAGNAISLNSGDDMALDIYVDPSVWLSQFGWFGFLNAGKSSQAVR